MNYLHTVFLLLMFLFGSSTYACHSQSPIKIGGLDWQSGQFSTALVSLILQQGYQCKTEIIPGTSNALETALIQNDVHIITEQWEGRSAIIEQGLAEQKIQIIGDTLKGGATQGWYVPRYIKLTHADLTDLQSLAKLTALFPDPENPQKARFLNCPTGWSCEIFNTNLLKNTGLDKLFNNTQPGTGAALDAEITSAYEQRKPILFYYWQPTALMAKYAFEPIEFPPYQTDCWTSLLQKNNENACISGFPSSRLAISVANNFVQAQPELVAFLEKMQFTPQQLNQAILEMSENKRTGLQQAKLFLQQYPEVWQSWLSEKAKQQLIDYLTPKHTEKSTALFANWSMADYLNQYLVKTVKNYGEQFRELSHITLTFLLLPVENLLQTLPAWLVIFLIGLIGWHASQKWWFALLCSTGFYFIGSLGLWTALMQTLALLVVSATFISLIGIPIGILMASNARLHRLLQPILDVIQTMPSFVYLIPVLMLFGIGKVPALFATVVYAIAPLIRLTALGIRQVSPQIIEAAHSFGSTYWQMLFWVLLPQAKPSIMAGVNQAVMMSLGMVVLASMIGAKGLGEYVLQAIQTLNIGQGVEAGSAIVILAIIIDRITQAYGRGKKR